MKGKQQKKDIWIFLSHSNEDYEKVRKVRNMLEEQELRPIMFFLKCLNDDDEIDSLIKREIECRTRFILCDSENARKSKWVQREVEYIRGQQKPYEIIDLTKSNEEITSQLKEVRRRSKLFIAYAMNDKELASYIYNRLSKYDFNIFIDYNSINTGSDYLHQINKTINSTAENGIILALLTESGMQSVFVNEEIELALEYGRKHHTQYHSVIPIVIGDNIPEKYANLFHLHLDKDNPDLPDLIVDAILKVILEPGEILTYYRNFKNRINHENDLIEADRLGMLFYKFALERDKVNIPSGTICLGICYEEGIGTQKDLQKAYEIFSDSVSTDGCTRDMAKRVYDKLCELYPEKYPTRHSKKPFFKDLFNRLRQYFREK